MGEQSNDETYLRRALESCRAGIEAGQSPFGASLVRKGTELAVAHNSVWLANDPTAHAEVMAIRLACGRLRSVHVAGATLYSTTEPCPMCFAAAHWARVDRIVFGCSIEDAASFGFNEMRVSNDSLKRTAGLEVAITGGVLRDEVLALFRAWRDRGLAPPY